MGENAWRIKSKQIIIESKIKYYFSYKISPRSIQHCFSHLIQHVRTVWNAVIDMYLAIKEEILIYDFRLSQCQSILNPWIG